MINVPLKNKSLLTGATFLTALFLLAIFVARPLIKQIQTASAQLISQREAVEAFFQNWQALEKSNETAAKISQDIKDNYSLLKKEEAVKFIMTLEKIAQATKNGHEITASEPPADAGQKQKTAKTEKLTEFINFQIALSGDFPALIKFLLYFENAPYFSQIKSLRINRATPASQSVNNEPIAAGPLKTTISIMTPVQ